MKKYYTGIGSRSAPKDIEALIKKIGAFLEKKDFILRNGDAQGSDSYFNNSVVLKENKEVYTANDATPESMKMASEIHPAWDRCSEYAKKLHGRNCFQVLGKNLNSPSSFLICWTPNGKVKGGSATAINLAIKNNIPVFNLGSKNGLKLLREFLNKKSIINH